MRSVDAETGERLSPGYLNDLARGRVIRAPEPWQLRALAAMLRMPLTIIQAAAADQYLNYVAESVQSLDGDTQIIVAYAAGLSEEERRKLRRMVQLWAEREEAAERSE